jgi:hypothetical protein
VDVWLSTESGEARPYTEDFGRGVDYPTHPRNHIDDKDAWVRVDDFYYAS